MKKALLLLIVLSVLTVPFISGEIMKKEPLAFEEMLLLMEASGVKVEGCQLQGWALIQDCGKAADVWEKRKIGQRLHLPEALIMSLPEGEGDGLTIVFAEKDLQADLVFKKIKETPKNDLFYLSLKCNFYNFQGRPGESVLWEKKIRDAIAVLGNEHGVYLTVEGKISPLDKKAQKAWAMAVFREIGAQVVDTLQTGSYTTITGHTPFFADIAVGKKKINFNLAMISQEEETRVLLGSPLITCEY
ncbi:MAG TPA: hypothetical protein GX502_02540 [Syntrophaceticus sp.]|nr:hypothetical protein [Syntrophaceticus sp.]